MPSTEKFRQTAAHGKLGLALSGGGFRAAFFHIGILAALAERDLLRGVERISTVSGGAIIGAYYYLKVKELLENRRRDRLAPSSEGYIRLVQEMEIGFLRAVQKNVRMRTFLDRRKNARMMREGYSPTERMAEIFSECFFAPLWGDAEQMLLRNLAIKPASPLPVKIPELIINTTTLNSGHLWQFTGDYVGEPFSGYEETEVATPRLKKLHFADHTLNARQRARLDKLTLGQAVAASCCVPGLFEPLMLNDLYQSADGEEIVINLVDGGVFDNQGLVSLFGENCTHFIASDASDILQEERMPSVRLINVAMRANDILMDRIRSKVLADLFACDAERYAFLHLGHEVGSEIFPREAERFVRALSHIRTDLDSFTDLEAYALMYYGYRLCARTFGDDQQSHSWRFLTIRDYFDDDLRRCQLLLHLEVGAKPIFKVFFLRRFVPYFIVTVAASIPLTGIIFILSLLPPWAWAGMILLVFSVLAYSQNARINQLIDRVEWLRRIRRRLAQVLEPLGIPMVVGLGGALISWVHLKVFDRLFLYYGRIN